MQIHLANCNLTHPPLQHLPVDESPRREEMKSVNIVQCSHTMYAKSAKERRNCILPISTHSTIQLIQEIVGPRNANQPSKRRMRTGYQSVSRKPLGIFATLSSCNPQYFHLTPKKPRSSYQSVNGWGTLLVQEL